MMNADGEFSITSWDEETYQEIEGQGRLARVSATGSFTGDLSGTGDFRWLMCYRRDGSARFVGLQRIEGTVDGRSGSFVVESVGDFDGPGVSATWSVLSGSGTGELAGLRGGGHFSAPSGSNASFRLDYRFE